MQNEPLYEPEDYPGMGVMPDQAAHFLGRHLGPALDRAGLDDTTILGYDHNWDITDYPEAIYSDRRAARYVPGTAWHCYAGEVSAQSVSHNNYPHAQAFQTECSGGDWQRATREAFELTMDSVIGVPRNWGQSVILWNLALDQTQRPVHRRLRRPVAGWSTVNERRHGDQEPGLLGPRPRQPVRRRPGAVRIGSSQPAGVAGEQRAPSATATGRRSWSPTTRATRAGRSTSRSATGT